MPTDPRPSIDAVSASGASGLSGALDVFDVLNVLKATDLVDLASRVGAHALPVFATLLLALLLVVALTWWVVRRHGVPLALRRLPPAGVVPVYGAAGFGLVVGAAALFAEIAEQLGPDATMARADAALAAAIHAHVSRATLQVFASVTHFGDTLTLALLGGAVALLLWHQRQRALLLGWVLAVAGNAVLNTTLKRIFERVRPIHEHGLVNEHSWSFPSGHTSGSTVAYCMLAYLTIRLLPAVWHLPAVLGAAALAFTVGSSRIFLQVHFASDVAAGFASGLAWLAVSIASVELGRHYRRRG